jgi:hypothetical protein
VTAREVLDGIKAQLSAITPGAWKVWGMGVMADPVGNSNVDDAHMIAVTSDPHRGLRTFNADFIASAPSTVARLTAAVESVLAECDYLDTLADGDKHYAKSFRAAIENALKESQ